MIVTAKNWSQRDAFLTEFHQALAQTAARKAYYPGAIERYQAFLARYPLAKSLGDTGEGVVPWTVIPEVPAQRGEYVLENEAFCALVAEVALDARDAGRFLERAVAFGNEVVWGTLSCTLLIDPQTEKTHKIAVDQAIAEWRYGAIGINIFTGVSFALMSTPWGAYPGHTLEDIQSGRGVGHNAYLLDHPQKSVTRAPFDAYLTPPWFTGHRRALEVGQKMLDIEIKYKRSWLKVPGIALAALRD